MPTYWVVNCDSVPDWVSQFLVTIGYHGIPGDGREAIYVPTIDVACFALILAFAAFVIVPLLIKNDREANCECPND